MNDLMERMQDLLAEARRQGIAEALAAVKDWQAGLTGDYDQSYLDGIDDAALTIEKL